MPFCQNCGTETGTGSGYCAHCGQKIEAGKPAGPVSYIHTARKEKNIWRIAFIISLVILIPVGIFLTVLFLNTSAELNRTSLALAESQQHAASLQNDLESTQQTLSETQQNLAAAITERDANKTQLTAAQVSLQESQNNLTSTQKSLKTMTADRDSYRSQLAGSQAAAVTLQNQLDASNNLLTAAQDKLSSATSTLSGLGITLSSSKNCSDVQLVDKASAKDPTWKELTDFLAADHTEDHAYIENEYDCSQFSRDLHNHAEAAGIRAAEVQIRFKGELTGHAVDAFLTTDYGLVFIDCTNSPDTIAHVKKGIAYRSVNIHKYNITLTNIKNDSWWQNLLSYGISYYYIPAKLSYSGDDEVVTSEIYIYW